MAVPVSFCSSPRLILYARKACASLQYLRSVVRVWRGPRQSDGAKRMAALNQRLLVLLSSMHMMNAQQLWIINSGSQYCRLTGGTCVCSQAAGGSACTFSASDLWSRSTVWSLASCSGCGSVNGRLTIYQQQSRTIVRAHTLSGLVAVANGTPYSVMSTFELCRT